MCSLHNDLLQSNNYLDLTRVKELQTCYSFNIQQQTEQAKKDNLELITSIFIQTSPENKPTMQKKKPIAP